MSWTHESDLNSGIQILGGADFGWRSAFSAAIKNLKF